MFQKIKYLITGSPLPTGQLAEKRLNKIRALAAFSPDALSSIAYANQEIYLGLAVAGSAGLMLTFPIGLAITILLVIVALSYFQTISGYSSGGGSYAVAKDNLGTMLGLLAAAALLVDYMLTAAVSLTAAVGEIASVFPMLWDYRIHVALALLLIITLANLRGIRETGTLMAVPVYLFLFIYFAMLAVGVVKALIEGPGSITAQAPPPVEPLSLILLLSTFSSGCTALTGIEAISNGVPVFKPPEATNARKTLIVMAVLMALLFVGSIGLTQYLAVVASSQETILSALSHRIFGAGLPYVLVQFSTMLILAVAANTSFAGFPRLAAILASDGFIPRQLANLGDRLVYTNGIMALAVGTGALIIIFGGNSHLLIPLFAIGVFLAFTLSQAGMVVHWARQHDKGWQFKSVLNGVGALATCTTVIIIAITKFMHGAWITLLLIPLIIFGFLQIKAHYRYVGQQLTLKGLPPDIRPFPNPRVVVPISGIHRGMFDAVNFARTISTHVTAVYIELEPGAGENMRKRWTDWFPDVTLDVVTSPYRSIINPILDYLDVTDREHNDGQMAVVIVPEIVPIHWWQELLHNQTSLLLKSALLHRRRYKGYQRVIIDVPYHLPRPLSKKKLRSDIV